MKTELIYRQLTALVFLAAFLAQTFNNVFVIADYYTNTNKYAKNCVNKASPMMHCNGKCQMMKKLQQEEKKEQENQDRRSGNKVEVVLSTSPLFAIVPTRYLIPGNTKRYLPSSDGNSIDRSFDIFHPPQA